MKYKTITLPVTKVRDQLFDLVNAGYYAGQRVIITKQNKPVMELKPIEPKKQPKKVKDHQKFVDQMKQLSSFLTDQDYQEMQKTRESLNTPRFPDW